MELVLDKPHMLLMSRVEYRATHRVTGRCCELNVDILDTFPELVDKWDKDGWSVATIVLPYDAKVYGTLTLDGSIVTHDVSDYVEIDKLKLRVQELTQDRDNWRAAATVAGDRARELNV